MLKIVTGFLSSLLGILIAERSFLDNCNCTCAFYFLLRVVIIGVCLGVSLIVNGCNYQMFVRSKADYAVNVGVSAVLGCGIAVGLFYLIFYQYIGRWVLLNSTIIFVVLNLILVGEIKRKNKATVLILGSKAVNFYSMLKDLRLNRLSEIYRIVDLDEVSSPSVLNKYLYEKFITKYYISDISANLHSNNRCVSQGGCDLDNRLSLGVVYEMELGVVDINSIRDLKWWDISSNLRIKSFQRVKRGFDLIGCVCLLFITLPIIFVAVVVIKILDGGPVIYSQMRAGQYGIPFRIFKLRTMVVAAEKNGAQWANVKDLRVTTVGQFLRKTRIDELPQLWNIIKGDMSLIGPRPERPEFLSVIERDLPEFSIRLACKPGLTGWAQINFPYASSLHDSKMKLMFDAYYIMRYSLMLDARILTRTVVAMVKGAR
jgi:lipopolysaccharide/colanic/teichoic acid biosynthesis glycosyltransferase